MLEPSHFIYWLLLGSWIAVGVVVFGAWLFIVWLWMKGRMKN